MGFLVMLLITVAILIYFWIRKKFNYWKDRGIETPSTNVLIQEKQVLLGENSFGDRVLKQYREFKAKNLRHGGIFFFFVPMYVPMDLEIVKSVLQVDFQHFIDRGQYINEKADPLSAHLFNLEGNRWKILRAKLSPTFTSGKMKMMFGTLVQCTKGLYKVMDKDSDQEVDIKDILGRFTTDVIGSVAFGLECNTLENPDSEFRKKGKATFEHNFWDMVKIFLILISPDLSKKLNLTITKPDVIDFFLGIVKSTVSYREENNISRKDFLQLLIELKNRGKLVDDEKLDAEHITEDENKISIEAVAAQCFIFFEAGFETSSTTMTFCLYELAKNKSIQDKVRKHINYVLAKHNGTLSYEAMMDMNYLEQTINETLRKYPPVPAVVRVCNKEYKVPGSDLILEKGTRVSIHVLGIHYDADYYPEPEKFDPDRFSEESKATRPAFTFLPFGEGPRICIGQRFGIMQTKIGLVALLRNYEFTLHEKSEKPFKFDPKNFLLAAKGDIWLNYKKIATPINLLS